MNDMSVSQWGAIAASVLSLLIFSGSLVASFFMQDTGLLNLVVGAAIANATTCVQYWVGSSTGSQKKDMALAAMAMSKPEAPAPVAVAISNPGESSTAVPGAH
jgi:hypothetical protein